MEHGGLRLLVGHMRYRKYLVAATAVAVGLLAACLLLPAGAVGASTAPGAASLTPPFGNLTAVSAAGADDVWAVGCRPAVFKCSLPEGDDDGVDAAYHWNGHVWKQVYIPTLPSPNGNAPSALLTGVAVISDYDAWAVGTGGGGAEILHWNGHIWKSVPAPILGSDPRGTHYALYNVAASSASNVWAVGVFDYRFSLTLHFNGRSWSEVTSRDRGETVLYGVATTSADNAWAVGSGTYTSNITGAAVPKALIEHWNGTTWQVVSYSYTAPSTFYSVAAVSPGEAWAGGYGGSGGGETLTARWNGTSWTRVGSGLGVFNPPANYYMFGMAATSSHSVWAVSSHIWHWTGVSWKLTGTPALPGTGNGLTGVAATSRTNAWAVGSYDGPKGATHIEILHWNGKAWSLVD